MMGDRIHLRPYRTVTTPQVRFCRLAWYKFVKNSPTLYNLSAALLLMLSSGIGMVVGGFVLGGCFWRSADMTPRTFLGILIGGYTVTFGFDLLGRFIHAGINHSAKFGTPAISAEHLFQRFIAPLECDSLLGDLAERYILIRKGCGKQRADSWYWTQLIRSAGPIVCNWLKRVALKP